MTTKSIQQENRSILNSFDPLIHMDCQVLILGSMPGIKSLQKSQYYAHPRNAFWIIMQELFGIDLGLEYEQRCSGLLAAKVAVWDVLKYCRREGSLDSKIQKKTEVANDFLMFLNCYKKISHIYFNGAKAENAYQQHVMKNIETQFPSIKYTRLPSTSPAYAALSVEEKISHWAAVKTSFSSASST